MTMEFSHGASLNDSKQLLLGTGKLRRHLTFTSKSDISKTYINDLLKQART